MKKRVGVCYKIVFGWQAKAVRQAAGESQTVFWGRIFVTQAAASRYEWQDAPLPQGVATLLTIAYGNQRVSQTAIDKIKGR